MITASGFPEVSRRDVELRVKPQKALEIRWWPQRGSEPVFGRGRVFARIGGRLPRPLRSETPHDSNTEGDRAPPTSTHTTSRKSLAGIRSKPSPTLGRKARRQARH